MTTPPEKMSGLSLDIAADRRAQLKQLLPSVFTETKNDKGELVESVDFEKLKAELGTFTDLFENRRERYGMDWPGKKETLKLIQAPSAATLKPCREESVNFDTTGNLFIEGDNLEVLKLLQKSYYGKVKMIYIDPPYNTGNEFIYPDRFSETLETYLEYAGQEGRWKDSQGANSKENPRVHTRWLNMMYPRLYLARNLLRDDGVIFISIDDNEVSNLRKMCDEIFGEENFVASVVWQKRTSPDSRANLSAGHDYLLIYGHSIDDALPTLNKLPLKETRIAAYKNQDNDPRGPWSSENLTGQTGHATPSQFYKVKTPSGNVYAPPEGRCWALAESTFLKLKADGRIWFGEDGNNRPRLKRFLSESDGMMAWTWWPNDEVGHNQEATKEAKELLGAGDIFDNPKPTRLISRVVNLATGKNDLILDFFAGSCTTAHSILGNNKTDNGNRKFILVQLPEPCPAGSEAFKAGYKTIADIGKERIRRVIKKIEGERAAKAKEADRLLPGMAEVQPDQDLGFRVLKLDRSNFKQWQALPPDTPPEKLVEQLKLFIDHIGPKASPEDLLFEILIKEGFPPSEPVETRTMAGKTVYAVAGGGLFLCLEEAVTAELINAVAEACPMRFVCLDAAFGGNDQLKANAVQTFAAHNLGKEKHNQIVFKTV